MKLGYREKAVLMCLTPVDWISPTQLGKLVWNLDYNSSNASEVCKRLVKKRLAHRSGRGHYRLSPLGCELQEQIRQRESTE